LKTITSVLIILLATFLVGCDNKATSTTEKKDEAQIALGKSLFNENCSQCHPAGGRGDYLKRIPATLLTRRSAAELSDWIEGRDQHREMPSFTDLTEEERYALAEYLFERVLSRP
jgi:mono/diheme cytochrome c family protein